MKKPPKPISPRWAQKQTIWGHLAAYGLVCFLVGEHANLAWWASAFIAVPLVIILAVPWAQNLLESLQRIQRGEPP